jgi:hypothetical protein
MADQVDAIIKVADDDPMRCVSNNHWGQCNNQAMTKGGSCPVHGGIHAANRIAQQSIRNYRLVKFQTELDRHADSPRLKSLNDEIAILRMLLEERLNLCKDAHDLILHSHLISDLVVKIEKVVKSCHGLESAMGGLMDKQAILTFASKVIEVISENIDDEKTLDTISNGILAIVGTLGAKDG